VLETGRVFVFSIIPFFETSRITQWMEISDIQEVKLAPVYFTFYI